ncbi:hypothetical protein [Gimesia panareensis]|nr:hypothetical protein [Gimesia panareensis]
MLGVTAGSRHNAFTWFTVEFLQFAGFLVVDVLQAVLAVAEIEIGVEQ